MPEPDDDDPVFVLGRGLDDLSPDEQHRRAGSKRVALWALAAVVVIVAVSITLVAVLVDTSSPPTSPRAAAQQWSDALVHGDRSRLRALQCADPGSAGVLESIDYAPTAAHAGAAARRARERWSVPVEFDEVGGGHSDADLTVIRRQGRYLVC